MSTEILFQTHLVLGYVAWLLCFSAYVWPWLKSMDRIAAQRAIATLHSFRFFGLVFILPGVVSPNLPASFATFAAYGDFATGVLAMLALLTVGIRPLFWLFVVAFNLVGTVDLVVDYYNAIQVGLPAHAEWLAATYAIPIIYVPLLMITHVVAFYLLLRPQPKNGASPHGRCGRILNRIRRATWLLHHGIREDRETSRRYFFSERRFFIVRGKNLR